MCLQLINQSRQAFAFDWPDEVQWVINLQKQVAAIAANIISVDCAAYQTGASMSVFYLKKLVFAFLPLIVVAVPFVLLAIWYGVRTRLLKVETSLESMRITLITSVIVVLFFLLPMITQQAFGMLSCIKLGVNSNDWYIIDHMDEQWCVASVQMCLCLLMLHFCFQ